MKIYELIDIIKRKPAMYIGYHSPTHLHSFINGYCYGDICKAVNEEDEFPDFNRFHDWVALYAKEGR